MAISGQTREKIGRYDLMEVAIRRIYYCTSGFRMIASTYFPSRFYYPRIASLKMRPARPRGINGSFAEVTRASAAIISIFPLFCFSALFSSSTTESASSPETKLSERISPIAMMDEYSNFFGSRGPRSRGSFRDAITPEVSSFVRLKY